MLCSLVSDSSRPRGLQHARLPCPSPSPGVFENSCPLSRWCHPTISSPVVPFSFCPQSFPASGSFPMSQLFASGGQSIEASASVLPMNIWDWFPLGLIGLISLLSKGLSRVFNLREMHSSQCFTFVDWKKSKAYNLRIMIYLVNKTEDLDLEDSLSHNVEGLLWRGREEPGYRGVFATKTKWSDHQRITVN